MQLASRIRKIENTLKPDRTGEYNGIYVTVWSDAEKPDHYSVTGDGIDFTGNKAEVQEFVKPYEDGGAFVLWLNVVRDWAM